MSCCGKKREEMRQRRTISVPPAPPPPTPAQPCTPVVFTGTGSYLVTGEHSRDVYWFSQEQSERWIDPADVPGLLSTGFFQSRE
ncbi:MAG: hypothetical protein ABSC88_07715 [Terracidiphilus sp.]|jgi:hypothetical protein